jgi:TM2 domain-containing membrane protein YozV
MGLSTQEQILIEQRVTNDAKSAGVAYLLWFFLGTLGVHRFYLGRKGSGLVILLLTIFGWSTAVFGVGILLLAIMAIWLFVDLFLIPGMVMKQKDDVRARLTTQALVTHA